MISAWRRLVQKTPPGNGQDANYCGQMPNGIQKLDRHLQKKFARGVQYNMKIVIKGDQRVGKTCLFNRLKGEQFKEAYNPTDEIQATTIHWNYKATDDVVKIDVWEAVDLVKRKRRQSPDLKLENNNNTGNNDSTTNGNTNEQPIPDQRLNDDYDEPALDASFIDVYKNANAVLLVFDMTKSWTFKYVQNELPKIPAHLPVLIISNHRDMGHHRAITSDQVKTYIEGLERASNDGQVLYAEASMKNGFGLRFIHKFFNIPYLRLQEITLLKQLEINRMDLSVTQEELEAMNESEEEEYDKFLEMLTIRRRQKADMLSPASGVLSANKSAALASGKSVPPIATTTNPICTDSMSSANTNDRPENNPNHLIFNRSPSIIIGANRPLPEKPVLKSKAATTTKASHNENHHHSQLNGLPFQKLDAKDSATIAGTGDQLRNDELETIGNDNDDDSDDSDDNPTANPLVANYQDELDPDDICEGVETGQHMSDR